jgi:hypothetical protein
MPEDAGKKRFINDFLQNVSSGKGFIEDIWIERAVKAPGTSGEASTAQSLSGRPVTNVTELLEDDLKHSFDDGFFTFRIVSALKGSGKTSLLTYLHELTKTRVNTQCLSVVIRFSLTDITTMGGDGNYDFSVRFYCYVLAETFWHLLRNPESSIQSGAKKILNEYLEASEINGLLGLVNRGPFRTRFIQYFQKKPIMFEEFFFEVIKEVTQIEPRFTFAYLIDEFDGLEKRPADFQQSLSLMRSLIKTSAQKFESKVRLFIYLVGTSDNIKNLFCADNIIESLVSHKVINLHGGFGKEFELIRKKIDARIQGAFKGYKGFNAAWTEIQKISPTPGLTLRKFCQEYAGKVLEIYQVHFKEEPEKEFEGNARLLVEAQCQQKWQKYLSQKAYSLSSMSTTTILKGHAFDCYIELLHNGSKVARGFGEAKNYELLSGHLETFKQWLNDAGFKPGCNGLNPPDLAFMIAPSCPPLLERKLTLENVNFIKSEKISAPGNSGQTTRKIPSTSNVSSGVNINTASQELIISAFEGTGIRSKTIDKLIESRKSNLCSSLDELASRLNLSDNVKKKLLTKLKENKIYFSDNLENT